MVKHKNPDKPLIAGPKGSNTVVLWGQLLDDLRGLIRKTREGLGNSAAIYPPRRPHARTFIHSSCLILM
jgi:hypothetical protein